MKAILKTYTEDGETVSTEEVVISISFNEEDINERILWVEVPTEQGEDEKVIEIYVHEILNELLERLGLRTE